MKFYYVYILLCNDDTLYVGVTSDIDRRVTEHNMGKYPEAYTHSRRPVLLVFIRILQILTKQLSLKRN
ncbi:GIY-YIG nuclease family protein [Flavobacterium sp. LS2R12]|uniref:GIY-YIG nuclease family protein n=1 Tax=unclassified Flavobacterium TaxID=196869 RepID=UPI003AAEAF7C